MMKRKSKEYNEEDFEGNINGRCIPSPQKKEATTAVGRYEEFYDMGHRYRGVALIFEHHTFDFTNEKRCIPQRLCAKIDTSILASALKKLDFHVCVHTDLPYASIEKRINEASKFNYEECDCVFVAVLSYGEEGKIYAKDVVYDPHVLWLSFTPDRCPTLANKPKLFFIQADNHHMASVNEVDGRPYYTISTQCDILVVYSTIPSSWFIQEFVKELDAREDDTDIITLLTFVNQNIMQKYAELETRTMKRVPSVNSMTIRLLVFGKIRKTDVIKFPSCG